MKTKRTRTIKVEATGDFYKREIRPMIRLRGLWLERKGFKPQGRVEFTDVAPGKLLLSYREP